jgi:cholesterol transport system auxiliary component
VSSSSLRVLLLASALAAVGCALTSKSVPMEIRYFEPEVPAATGSKPVPVADDPHGRPRLRIGRVTASAHLRSRIVFRRSAVESGTYDDRRWTENPEAFVRRSLEAALFDDRRLLETLATRAPTLEVELVTFEEVRNGTARSGRVELAYTLYDDENVISSGRLAVERAARSPEMGDVVVAISLAMNAATAELSRRVAERLTATQ